MEQCQFSEGEDIYKIVFSLEFPIRVLSIDSLVNEAIRAFNDNEQASGLRQVRRENKEPLLDPKEISKIQASEHLVCFFWYTTDTDQDII